MSSPEPAPGLRSARLVGEELHLVLENSIDAVDAGRLELRRWVDPHDLSPRVINRLEVVFEEVVSNVIRHGFDPQRRQTLLVVGAITAEAIDLTFADDGRPFDPLAVPEPQPFKSLDTASLGGLGVSLVRKFATRASYEPVGSDEPVQDVAGRAFAPCNRLRVSIATGS
jgi:anti-sigma regulatory factor (Ser/Thr protein kinase)